jgi:hypothetical protein
LRLELELGSELVSELIDPHSANKYHYNKQSGQSSWKLPLFMNNIFDHKYNEDISTKKKSKRAEKAEKVAAAAAKEELKKKVLFGDENQDDDKDDDSEDDDASADSDKRKEKRRHDRKFPRSKVQALVDFNEDNLGLKGLNLSGIGASRFTSRLYDFTDLTSLG